MKRASASTPRQPSRQQRYADTMIHNLFLLSELSQDIAEIDREVRGLGGRQCARAESALEGLHQPFYVLH
jgi:hypothetical protein